MWSLSCSQLQPVSPVATGCSQQLPLAVTCCLKLSVADSEHQANEAVKLSTRCKLQLLRLHTGAPAGHMCSWSLGVADQCSRLEGCCQEQPCCQEWSIAAAWMRARNTFQLQERGLSQVQVRGLCQLH